MNTQGSSAHGVGRVYAFLTFDLYGSPVNPSRNHREEVHPAAMVLFLSAHGE